MLRSRVVRSLIGSGRISNAAVNSFRIAQTVQVRHMNVFRKYFNKESLERLKVEAAQGSPASRMEYLRQLVEDHPDEALTYVESQWRTGGLPVDEATLRLFVLSTRNSKQLDRLNFGTLFARIKAAAAVESAAPGAAVGTPAPAGPALAAGGSKEFPLYMEAVNSGGGRSWWSSVLGNVVASGVSLMLVVALIAWLNSRDNKDSSKGGQSNSSISGSLNPFSRGTGSAVHLVEHPDKTFKDVVGVDEAKADLEEIVAYLKDPSRFTRLGGTLPKGVLLTGPPGTGKTLLARAVAGEAGVPFFFASGAEFEEMFVGVGAKRVRDLFETAKKQNGPCIIFIDEIDAIGGARQMKDQAALKMTLNQLLVEMDGFTQNSGIIVIGATNLPDALDPALVRPGRLDKHVVVGLPDIGGRKAILSLYAQKIPLDKDVDMELLARGTPGFSGAELFNLLNTAALKASVENLLSVDMKSLEYAKDKLMMGAERTSAVLSPETLRCTAFHEAGHALVALKTPGANPIHKATIMPRGRALGMVMQLPDGDQVSQSRREMLAHLDICMGGRVAEELVFGHDHVTSGASSDLQSATRLARAMVTRYGFSEKIGAQMVPSADESQHGTAPSQALLQTVDAEVKALLDASYARTVELLTTHRDSLNSIAEGLLEFESLSGSEVAEVVQAGGAKVLRGRNKRSQQPSRPVASSSDKSKGDKDSSKGKVPSPNTNTSTSSSTASNSTKPSPSHSQKQTSPSSPAAAETAAETSAPAASSAASSSAVRMRAPPKA